jgi:membrane peptidoglycan carboxypeptidase
MASAYTAFVNHGIRASLMFVTKIEDSEGNVVAQFQPRMNEVISEESAHKMLYMLKAVVDAVSIPVIASGGAGKLGDFAEAFEKTDCSAALAASLFHFKELTVGQVKADFS